MHLTEREHEILKAVKDTPPDCGTHASIEAVSNALPAHTKGDLEETLRILSGKDLVGFDEHGCVMTTESGDAALNLI